MRPSHWLRSTRKPSANTHGSKYGTMLKLHCSYRDQLQIHVFYAHIHDKQTVVQKKKNSIKIYRTKYSYQLINITLTRNQMEIMHDKREGELWWFVFVSQDS